MQPTASSVALMRETWMVSRLRARRLMAGVRRMASAIEGGCLCGGVRYRLHVRPKQGSDCHCEDCRRASAAPYLTWCSVPSQAIEVLSGELRRVSYADRLRSFASCCGTPLFIQDEVGSEWIDVTVASLDDPGTFHPEVAIWTEDKSPVGKARSESACFSPEQR